MSNKQAASQVCEKIASEEYQIDTETKNSRELSLLDYSSIRAHVAKLLGSILKRIHLLLDNLNRIHPKLDICDVTT